MNQGWPGKTVCSCCGGLTTIRRGRTDWQGFARLHPEMLTQPLRWTRPRRIFVNSMSDLFHESLSFEEIAAVFGVMAACPQHTFQVLTKRPKRALEFFAWVGRTVDGKTFSTLGAVATVASLAADHIGEGFLIGLLSRVKDWPLPNVHLGVSIEDQKTADERIPLLLQCPAAVRWVSAEPLLDAVDIIDAVDPGFWKCGTCGHEAYVCMGFPECCDDPRPKRQEMLDWVVVGGESGPGARPCDVEWIRSIVSQCKDARVPVFVKQLGCGYSLHTDLGRGHHHGEGENQFICKHKSGADPSEWPEDLRVQEYPEAVAK